MAITQQVFDPSNPSNTKQVSIDLVSRIPAGGDGDEKYILYIYPATGVYGPNRSTIPPVFIYTLKRGWAQSFVVNSPFTSDGGTLTVAIDEADGNAVTLTVASGTYSLGVVADSLQSQLLATTASGGAKYSSSVKLSYMNAQVKYEDGRLTFLSGSTKDSYNGSATQTSSVKVTGGTVSSQLGFSSGYPNSYDMAATTSGVLHGPASAHVSVDDAIRFGIMTIANQIDFSS